jgi:hypothetical protein
MAVIFTIFLCIGGWTFLDALAYRLFRSKVVLANSAEIG